MGGYEESSPVGGPVHNVQYGTGYHIPHPPALRKCYGQKQPRPPPPPQARTAPVAPRGIVLTGASILQPAKALENAEASAALAQASERPGGRPKGADEVPSVLAGPDIVRSSAAQRFADVQDNCGGVGQSELVLAGE